MAEKIYYQSGLVTVASSIIISGREFCRVADIVSVSTSKSGSNTTVEVFGADGRIGAFQMLNDVLAFELTEAINKAVAAATRAA